MASSLATCLVHYSVAVSESESERERESEADFGEGRSCGLLHFASCGRESYACEGRPFRKLTLQNPPKKSAEKIRPDLLQMLGTNMCCGGGGGVPSPRFMLQTAAKGLHSSAS